MLFINLLLFIFWIIVTEWREERRERNMRKWMLRNSDFAAKNSKSEVWERFDHVHNETTEPVGYVKYKRCDILLKYNSKMTLEFVADKTHWWKLFTPVQPTITPFVPASEPMTAKVKQTLKKCLSMRPFNVINGEGFEELAQALNYVWAAYGKVTTLIWQLWRGAL